MLSISSKYRKPKGRPSKCRAVCTRNLEKGKSSACSSSDSKCDEISTGDVPSTSVVIKKIDFETPVPLRLLRIQTKMTQRCHYQNGFSSSIRPLFRLRCKRLGDAKENWRVKENHSERITTKRAS
ncbi:hypothetical protein TNCT_629681 [Trichonephila clavata]|uniref:Uncharacterized protein n=1 Tax=Trichonephila clavata TaxID=2740835 RepID=A0A8X6FJX6_TRICU|nr:hypothetical protein TNCT_629681 [Trichonephila clavata]